MGIEQTGRTTLFKLSLPLPPAGGRGPRERERRRRRRLRARAWRGLHVLVVDDESDARQAVAGILSHHGASCRRRHRRPKRSTRSRASRSTSLLADICMPGEDGYDLIRRIRGLRLGGRGLPAAAVTACAADHDRQRALQAGFQVHLPKPIDPQMLVSTVVRLGNQSVRA